MKKVRLGAFETNSSSTHSLIMCTKEQFEKWKNDEIRLGYGDNWNQVFIDPSHPKWDDEDTNTYESYESDYLEYFEQEYTTPNGEVIVAFGEYGYDG